MPIYRGSTRTVIVFKKWAFKFAGDWRWCHRTYWWENFLKGLLANCEETKFGTLGWSELCPVIFSVPGGFLIVMPYARPLSEQAFLSIDHKTFSSRIGLEEKCDSFGVYNGRIVAVDYGN